MKPAQNALRGYTYQEKVIFFLLVKMDVEREIDKIEIEATVEHKFDDALITINGSLINCQMKDHVGIKLDELRFRQDNVVIKGTPHELSNFTNIIFFKHIDIETNSEILGLPSLFKGGVHLVSLSRQFIHEKCIELYEIDPKRESILDGFFSTKLDTAEFSILRSELPAINIFKTELLEKTIDVSKEVLKVEDLLLVEGKPGVGKSHFVNFIKKDYANHILYRFWVSNQDEDYRERLSYIGFLSNLSKEIFSKYKLKTEEDILLKLEKSIEVLIIDGFDHVENYNNDEINLFIEFIQKLQGKCRVIVLSRPLKMKLNWKKWTLNNWDKNQTDKALNELYHISDYSTQQSIFNLTKGYPILIKFIAEHFKKYNRLPDVQELEDTEQYYNEIIKEVKTKRALSLFLSSNSYFMRSEFKFLVGDEVAEYIDEFVNDYPYLFEIKLNRVSLLHDSFNTYLRNLNFDFSKSFNRITQRVYDSIITEESRFLSRFSSFQLGKERELEIIKKYSDIGLFRKLTRTIIDFEAVRSFYAQLRDALVAFNPADIQIHHYYDLSLIINITVRDHISSLHSFYYTYAKTLFANNFSLEDITSSGYLFGVVYYMETSNDSLLRNVLGNDNYETDNFYFRLKNEVLEEKDFFLQHQKRVELSSSVEKILNGDDSLNAREMITAILENLYIHKTKIAKLKNLQNCIETYIDDDEHKGIRLFERLIEGFGLRLIFASMILREAKKNIHSLGFGGEANKYRDSTLAEFILTRKGSGSFSMREEISSYLRLALEEERSVDIESIGLFWTMYYERKDTTVLNLPIAIKIFEEKRFLTEAEGFDLIVRTQLKSEKGIRHLLSDYIEIHSPEIVSFALDSYSVDQLEIEWFNLSSSFINVFPNDLFEYALDKILRYRQSSETIEFFEVENLFDSNRWQEFVEIIRTIEFKISIDKEHHLLNQLKSLEFIVLTEENERFKEIKDNNNKSVDRYKNGILTSEDIEIIDLMKIDISEIGSYRNDYYSVFSDLGIFQPYGDSLVKKNMRSILHAAITARLNNINASGNLFYFLGNLPKMMDDYEIDVDFKRLYNSFDSFLEISLLKNN